MASLLQGFFDGFSNHYFKQITYYILNRQMAFLLCGYFHVFSIDHFACHIVCKGLVTFGTGKWLPTLCEPFHKSYFVTLFDGLASKSLPMKRFGVDCYLFWDLFHTVDITLGPIPQFQYSIVDIFDRVSPCVNPFMNLYSLFTLFKGLTSLKLPKKRFGVDYHLFWDLFHTMNVTLGPIP